VLKIDNKIVENDPKLGMLKVKLWVIFGFVCLFKYAHSFYIGASRKWQDNDEL
jgi:hypothetical protein